MKVRSAFLAAGLTAALSACVPCPPGDGTTPTTSSTTTSTTTTTTTSTTTSTTTTTAPLQQLRYSGSVTKINGCYDPYDPTFSYSQPLGTDGWWNFGFVGCSNLATETVRLVEAPLGGVFGDEFRAPTGYQCSMNVDGDVAGPYTQAIGSVGDTGGIVFLNSSHTWPNTLRWTITCDPL